MIQNIFFKLTWKSTLCVGTVIMHARISSIVINLSDTNKQFSQYSSIRIELLPLTAFWSTGCRRTRRPYGPWTAASYRPGWRRQSPPPPSGSGTRTRLTGGSPAIAGCTSAPPCPTSPCFRRPRPRFKLWKKIFFHFVW